MNNTMNGNVLNFKFTQKLQLSRRWMSPAALSPESLLNVIDLSYVINTHKDYYDWLQQSVQTIIPHNILLACWGIYDQLNGKEKLNYDIASSIPSIQTQLLLNHLPDADVFMRNLHQTWCDNAKRWFVVNDIQKLADSHPHKPSFLLAESGLNALLVYGVSDIRTNTECLYVFFSKLPKFPSKDLATGYIMPHIDSVLRRIKHLSQEEPKSLIDFSIQGLTKKELVLMDLLKLGMSNKEMSQILNISPNTTKVHLKQIFRKLEVTNRTQAVSKVFKA